MHQNPATVPVSVCVWLLMQTDYTNGKVAGASCFTYYMDKFSVIYPFQGTAVAKVGYFTIHIIWKIFKSRL